MVAIKSLAISTVCMMSMIGSSFQQIDSATGFIDSTVWPLAFVKNCQLQLDIMDTLNNVLNGYYRRGYSCPNTLRQKIDRGYKCPVNAVSFVLSVAWPTEFQRQSDMNEKIKAQIDCLNLLTNGIGQYQGNFN
jgi:hypothetical protein